MSDKYSEIEQNVDHMHLRKGKKIALPKAVKKLPPQKRPWRMPAYHTWPDQTSGADFVKFVGKNLTKFDMADGQFGDDWKDNCVVPEGEFLELLPFQQFLAQILSPKTTLRRALIGASTGSGKTMVVAQILCNFLQHDYDAKARVRQGKRVRLAPGGQPKPKAIYVVTQNAKLREDLWGTIQNKARCARRPGQDFQLGRLNEDLHPYWWAERWFQSHDVPVEVLTYGAAINRPSSDYRGSVVILDEAHTLVDTSALVVAQRNVVLRFKAILQQADPQVLIGLTGTPLGRGWKDFLDIHNLFCVRPEDRLDASTFAAEFLVRETLSAEDRKLLESCLGKDAKDIPAAYDAWRTDAAGERALKLKVAPYMFYYDGSFDLTRFARAIDEDVEYIKPSDGWMQKSQYTSAGKPRANMVRTRLVAVDNTVQSTETIVSQIKTEADLEEAAPVVAKLLRNLAARKRKAVIYSDVYAPLGSTFVYHVLNKFKSGFATAGAPILYLRNDDTKPMQRRAVEQFNRHQGTGSDSAVLVLGPSYSTGINLDGAAGEFHLLDVLPNFALEQQARGRVHRSCSHRGLPQDEWRIFYYQYVTDTEARGPAWVSARSSSDASFRTAFSGLRISSGGARGPGCSKHRKADCLPPLCKWGKGRCVAHEAEVVDDNKVVVKKEKKEKKEKQKKELPLTPTCDHTLSRLRERQDSVMLRLTKVIKDASLGCVKLAPHHRHPASDCAGSS